MARGDYVERTRDLLYGAGLGEKPSLRRVAAAAAETIAAPTISFSMFAGEGQYIRPGHVLSAMGGDDPTKAFSMYVLSVATDAVTATLQYQGSPASTTDELDGLLLEQNALVTDWRIQKAVDTVIDSFLYPYVTVYNTYSVTPNLVSGQVEVAASIREIISCTQVVQLQALAVPFTLMRNLHTTVSSTGSLASLDTIYPEAVYLTVKERAAIGDETSLPALIDMVAFGAAALCLEASVAGGMQERAHKDAMERDIVADNLWRSFMQLRQQHQEDIARDNDSFYLYRG